MQRVDHAMAGPFRVAPGDEALAQTLGITIEVIAQFRELEQGMRKALDEGRFNRSRDGTKDLVAAFEERARVQWDTIWDLLGTARTRVAALGRPVDAYDQVRAEVIRRDSEDALKPPQPLASHYALYWMRRPVALAEEALLHLRAAVPWIEARTSGPVEDLRSSSRHGPVVSLVMWGLLLALVGVAIYAC